MNKALSLLSTVVVGAGAVMAIAATTAPTATAAAGDLPTGYYGVPYSPAVLYWDESTEKLTQLTYAQWQSAGAPTPQSTAAETLYGRYPWSPGIVGATFFTNEQSQDPVFYYEGLTPSSWARAGNPTPEVVTQTVLPGSSILKYTSSDELFIDDATNTIHKLTFPEWSALGTPAATTVGSVQKYSFNDTLYLFLDSTDDEQGLTVALTGAQWGQLANPTPATASGNRLPGDAVFAFSDNPGDIYLRTPTKQVWHLDFPEWESMNAPQPVLVTPPGEAPSASPSAAAAKDSAAHHKDVHAVRAALGLG